MLTLVLLMLDSCASVKAPKGSVPQREGLYEDAFGGWIQLNVTDENSTVKYQGEFICVDRDSIYLLTRNNDLVHLAKEEVGTARLIFYNTETGKYAGWTTFGAISTASHGGFLTFTLPMWLIGGSSTTTGESRRENYLNYPPYTFEQLGKYSRFPQGLPAGLNLEQLKKKPIKK